MHTFNKLDKSTPTKINSMDSKTETSPHDGTYDCITANENEDFSTNMNSTDIVLEAGGA